MLFRIVIKSQIFDQRSTWKTEIICTKCGQKNIGSTYKKPCVMHMSLVVCPSCKNSLGNQEVLNKSMEARIVYHESD